MKAISEWFYGISKPLVVIAAIVLFFVFSLAVLPGQSETADGYSQGMGSPDTSLFYSGNTLYKMAEVYGEEGRAAYLKARWTFDLAFPFVYTIFLITSTSFLLDKALSQASKWRMLNLVPLVAMIFDFLENISTSLVMARYPLRCPFGEFLGPVSTPLKWIFVGSSFVLLLLSLIGFLLKQIKNGKNIKDH